MRRPRLLDLYCGAGGSAVGYHRAGFDIVGVDIVRQPRYPYTFVHADAMTFDLQGYDAIHASPPCQRFSITRHTHDHEYEDLLTPTLARLAVELTDHTPWIVENVKGSPMPNAVEVCGAALCPPVDDIDGVPLVLRRHRLFVSNVALLVPTCACAYWRTRGVRVGGVYGAGPENRNITNRALGTFRGGYTPTFPIRAALLGIAHHMTGKELSQAIPPAYTEMLGQQLHAHTTPDADWEQLTLFDSSPAGEDPK